MFDEGQVQMEWCIEQLFYMHMKKIVERDFLLSYPNFSEIFIIHDNDRKMHLGGVISQNGKPIAL